ncbi:MAG: hypothetical protein DDT22_01236 [candidate division WS2 bacterium]|nr:hypothetical protein [Candidatus Lithacetigena glycinireducens]
MHLVENIHFIGRSERQGVHALGERANVLHAVVARGIHLVEVVLGTADRAREYARDAGLPETARAGEEIRMAYFLRLRRLLKRLRHLLLPYHVGKRRRTVYSIERLVRHRNSIQRASAVRMHEGKTWPSGPERARAGVWRMRVHPQIRLP